MPCSVAQCWSSAQVLKSFSYALRAMLPGSLIRRSTSITINRGAGTDTRQRSSSAINPASSCGASVTHSSRDRSGRLRSSGYKVLIRPWMRAVAVLHVDVENVALLAAYRAHGDAADGNGQRPVDRQPRLAELLASSED